MYFKVTWNEGWSICNAGEIWSLMTDLMNQGYKILVESAD